MAFGIGRVCGLTIAAMALVFGASIVASAAGDDDAIIASVNSGDTVSAIEQLSRLETTDAARFRANNYDYLLGRLLEQRGDFPRAVVRFTSVVSRDSNLAEYALWRLAGIARLQGNYTEERRLLEQLLARYPASLLYARAVRRAGRSAFDAGDYRAAIARLQPLAVATGADGRGALARVGAAKLRLGDRSGARSDFQTLLDGPQDDYALQAARGLDELDAAENVALTEFDHMRRGQIYLNNRDWLDARPHFEAIAAMPASQYRADALYAVGLTHYRLEELDDAVTWWQKAAQEFATIPVGIKSALWIGHALQRAGKYDAAVSQYDRFIATYPRDDQVEGAYRNAIDTLRTAGRPQQALAWCDRAEAAQPRGALATFAAFNRAKIRLGQGDTAAALAEFVRLKTAYNLSLAGPGMPSSGEIDLLRGVCLERLGRYPEAIGLYLTMKPGRENYFGNRATIRLLALADSDDAKAAVGRVAQPALAAARTARTAGDAAGARAAAERAMRLTIDEPARAEMLDILRWSYSQLPQYSRVSTQAIVPVERRPLEVESSDRSHAALAAELAFLGLYDEAAPELEASGFGLKSAASMAVYNARGGRAHEAIQIGETTAARLPDDYRVELLPRSVSELIYPAPYREDLRRFAIALGVDPRFELSIARQESRFKPWVKSPAAARGLMQFITETSSRLAVAEGIAAFDQDDLYEPSTAIRLGARYLSELFAMFPDNGYLVAASYNGGEDNVERWKRRAVDPDDVDLVIAEISYKETKAYVYRVMNNYWAYQALYSRELSPAR